MEAKDYSGWHSAHRSGVSLSARLIADQRRVRLFVRWDHALFDQSFSLGRKGAVAFRKFSVALFKRGLRRRSRARAKQGTLVKVLVYSAHDMLPRRPRGTMTTSV